MTASMLVAAAGRATSYRLQRTLAVLVTTASIAFVTPGLQSLATVPSRVLPRLVVRTTVGPFTLELDAKAAPETVRRFLTRDYSGLQLCEARARGYLVFGCAPFRLDGPKGDAPHREPPLIEEIDAVAMGLREQPIEMPQPIDWLWQQEVFPLYVQLREKNRPIPPGLQSLVDAARTQGTVAKDLFKGKSRIWYLSQLGHTFTPGRSAARFSRGAVGVAAYWPGAGDERFVIALTDLPERDGRATVFGRVVDGWSTLERIERLPVDKSHRTLSAVYIEGTTPLGSSPEKDRKR